MNWRFLFLLTLTLLLTVFIDPALADNCGSLSDCYNMVKNAAIAAVGIGVAVSLILDLLPVIGDIKGIMEGITGRDSVTGERLKGWQRALGAIPIIGRLADIVKAAGKAVDATKVAPEATDVAKAAAAAGDTAKAADAAHATAKATNEAAKTASTGSDTARAAGKTDVADEAAAASNAAKGAEAARSAGKQETATSHQSKRNDSVSSEPLRLDETIRLPRQSGLEAGAIPGNLPARPPAEPLNPPTGWSELPVEAVESFAKRPQADVLPSGTKIYRIIGKGNNPRGSFWTLEPPPKTETEWRAGWAVKNSWNGDGGYVEHTVGSDGLKVWRGPAAAQEAGLEGWILPGGREQVWIPSDSIDVAPDALFRTPWNPL